MEESILSDINSYGGGSEIGLEDVYSRSETFAVSEDIISIELDKLDNDGILYTSVDIADVSPRAMSVSQNMYEGIEPAPEPRVSSPSGNRYLESAEQLNPINQSSDSVSDGGSVHSENSNADETSWNERFQRIYNTENSLEKYLALGKLVKDFVDTAQTYAKVIISESALPVSEKTIKPKLDIGIAGGDKYICAGILFKYATDKELNRGIWMYGGVQRRDEFALKSANHELKGIISYLNAGVKELCLPLMAVIDYAGVRLVAVALLPINEMTLRYGSNNAGRTIHNSDKKLNQYIEQVARKLNIKGHPVGLTKKVLFSPGDLEGHIGDDGRYYVLDFARLYPPEPPSQRNLHTRATWFNLLRPELVASNPVPLSPDAYSCFESEDTRAVSKKEIVNATVRLYKGIIPKFAKDFDDAQNNTMPNATFEHGQLIESLHRAGINIRHLGFVLLKCTTKTARSVILTEMVARVIKNEIKNAFRDQSMLFSSRDKIQQIILDELNAVTSTNSVNHVTFWANRVHTLLHNKFQYKYAEDPLNAEVEIETLIDKRVLVEKLETMIGFKLTHAAKQSFFESGTAAFLEVDIKSIEPRVKHLNIVDYAEGAVYMYLAKSCGERETSRWKQYLQNAIKSFASALSAAPFDGSSCYKLARCLHKIAELELDNAPFESLVKQASEKYSQSILFGYSPEKVLERRGQLLLMAAGRTNEEKYYQLAGESYQQAFRYPSCMRIIKELFDRAHEGQGEKLLNTLKLSLYCPVLQQQFSHELTRVDIGKVDSFSQAELLLLFSGLKEVKELYVSTLNINDEFVEFAANKWPTLERIDISGILNITDRGLAALCKCSALKYVKLDKMGMISKEGLIRLSKACTKIEELSICQCSQITETCLIQVTDNLPHLQHFHCIMFHELQPKLFTSEGLIHLVRPGTKTLRVSTQLTNTGAAQLIEKINQTGVKIERLALLREYDMVVARDPELRAELISEESFIPLFTVLPHLKSIEISNFYITDDALRFMLMNCSELEKIVLDCWNGTDLSCQWLDAITPNNSKLQYLKMLCPEDESSSLSLIKQLATSCPRITTLKTDRFYLADELIAISNCFPYLQSLATNFHRVFDVDDIVIRLCCESWRNMEKINFVECDSVCGMVDSFITMSRNTPKLRSLTLRYLENISPGAFAEFFYQPKPKITKLDLYKSAPINDEAMFEILPLVPNLTHLNLSFTRVTNKTVSLIGQHVPKLRKLYMDGVAGLSDSAFIEIAPKLKHLRILCITQQMSLNGTGAAYFAYYCDNLQSIATRVNEDLYVEPSVMTSPLTSIIIWRVKILFLFCKKIQGPMRIEMLKKSAEILSRVLHTMPQYLDDYKAFWLSYGEKKMSADELHQYIFMLDFCPQIVNLLKSYWHYYPDDELFTSNTLTLTRNNLVSKPSLIKVLSILTQPITLHLENCMWFTPTEVADVLASFQFKSLHLSNDTWQLFHHSIAQLSTISLNTLVSLEVPNHFDLQALDVAKFSNLTNLDASFSSRDSTWGAGELAAVLASCKSLKRVDFSGRHHASASALTDSDASLLSFEKFRAGVGVSLADASRILKSSRNLRDLRIRIGANGGLDSIIIANLVSLELFETCVTSDMLTSLTACQHLKELSIRNSTFGADSHDAFRTLFNTLSFTKLVLVPQNKRDLNYHVFESMTQQSQLEHLEIAFHPCPRWQTWVPFIEKNVSLKKFIIRENSMMVHYLLQQIVPLFPPLEAMSGISLDNSMLAILAQNSQKTLKDLRVSPSSDLTDCKALGLCRDLEVLDLSYCNVKDEELMHVTNCLSSLTEVNLTQCKNISSDTIISLLQHCPKMRRLHLSECVHLTDSLLPALEQYGHCLEYLDLTRCPLLTQEKIDQVKLFSLVQMRFTTPIFGGEVSEQEREVHVSYETLFKALARKVCTRSLLKNYSVKQEATRCNTCQVVVCKPCLIKCHKGHEVDDERYFSVTCHCVDNCKCQK